MLRHKYFIKLSTVIAIKFVMAAILVDKVLVLGYYRLVQDFAIQFSR